MGEAIDLAGLGNGHIEACEQAPVVLDGRLTPTLCRVRNALRTQLLERPRIESLHGAHGLVGIAVLERRKCATAFSQGQPAAECDSLAAAVAFVKLADPVFGAESAGLVAGHEVDDAGDRVGAVLRRRAIAQDLNAIDAGRRDDRCVRSLRTAERAGEDGAAMQPLAVDKNERVIRGQAAQRRRAHQ